MPMTQEQLQVKDMVRRFADDRIRPVAAELDEQERYPAEIFKAMAELGLLGITVPVEDGGAGMDSVAYAVVIEELSRGYAAVADSCGLVELLASLLSTHGTAEQKARYLAPLLRAERCGAYALTEPEAGSDLAGLKTTARRSGDGWVLDGGKLWINCAPICDFACVLARTDPAAGHRGMSIFLVDADLPGFSHGRKEKKMGQRANPVGALHFDGIALGPAALLGPEGRGFHMMMSVLEKGRICIASLAVGIAQAGLEAALAQARERRQFGQAIVEFQGLQWLLADMAKDITAARCLIHEAARTLDAEGSANMLCSMAKCFATDMAVQHAANAVQVFGGSGFIRGFEVERLYRDVKITQIYEGTNQIQRTIIAKELLKHGA
jgi:alkylation response protein AidB-like acyl-CoA dehydrogenase